MTKISLCIPTYNRAELLKKLLNQLITYNIDDLEIIVVDNKSTDETIELFKNNTYKKIKFFQNPKNIGMANNWNRCIELATGDYIIIFHSDDMITEELITMYKKIIRKYPSIGFVFSYYFKIDASDQIIGKTKVLKGNLLFSPPSFYYLMICANIIAAPGVLIKKECYEKVGRFQDFDLIADYDMWLRIALNYAVIYVDKPLYSYRVHLDNLSKTIPEKEQLREKIESYKKIVSELKGHREMNPKIKYLTELRYRYTTYKYLTRFSSNNYSLDFRNRIIKFSLKYSLLLILDYLKSFIQKPTFFEKNLGSTATYYYPRWGFFLNLVGIKIYFHSLFEKIRVLKLFYKILRKKVSTGLT